MYNVSVIMLLLTISPSLVEGDEGCIGPSGCCVYDTTAQKNLQNMYGNIPFLFDIWAVLRLLISFYQRAPRKGK